MLEKVDLTRKLSKGEYKARLPYLSFLRDRLYDLQKACWDASIPSVVLFEGWDAAGKGTSINLLTQRLDPRGFKLYAIQGARTYETHMPWLWRFWLKLPNYGEMAIFDRSWYGRVLVERVEGFCPENEWRKGYRDIADFERTIADDGYVLIKCFLHISKKEQLRRFRRLERDPLESWHVQPEDWMHHRKYEQYVLAIEEMLERTDTEWGRGPSSRRPTAAGHGSRYSRPSPASWRKRWRIRGWRSPWSSLKRKRPRTAVKKVRGWAWRRWASAHGCWGPWSGPD